MTDIFEDIEILLGRAINCLNWLLNEINYRIQRNRHRPVNCKTLVRWISVFMPEPKNPRLKLQADFGPSRLDRWGSCGSLQSLGSFSSLNEVIQENLGENLVRFRKGNESDESDNLEEPQFLRNKLDHLTSTPNMNMSSCSSHLTNDLTANFKLAEMEEELAVLRKQIAMLVMAQELTPTSHACLDEAKAVVKHTEQAILTQLPEVSDSSLDDSGCESEHLAKVSCSSTPTMTIQSDNTDNCLTLPPPPPPLPPKPSTLTLKNKAGNNESHEIKCDHKVMMSSKPNYPVMTHILKDLSNVKLRSVQRSPGGTPMRRKPLSVASDPASIIAQALKKKFAFHKRYSSDSDVENESHSFKQDHSSLTSSPFSNEVKRCLSKDNTSDNWSPAGSPLKLWT